MCWSSGNSVPDASGDFCWGADSTFPVILSDLFFIGVINPIGGVDMCMSVSGSSLISITSINVGLLRITRCSNVSTIA